MQRGSTVSTPRSARHSEIVAAYEDTQLHFSGYSPRPSSASSTKSKRKSSSRNSRSPSNSFSFNYSDKLKSVVQTYKKGHEEHVEIQSVKESLTDDKLDKHFQIMTGRLPSPRLRYSPRRKLDNSLVEFDHSEREKIDIDKDSLLSRARVIKICLEEFQHEQVSEQIEALAYSRAALLTERSEAKRRDEENQLKDGIESLFWSNNYLIQQQELNKKFISELKLEDRYQRFLNRQPKQQEQLPSKDKFLRALDVLLSVDIDRITSRSTAEAMVIKERLNELQQENRRMESELEGIKRIIFEYEEKKRSNITESIDNIDAIITSINTDNSMTMAYGNYTDFQRQMEHGAGDIVTFESRASTPRSISSTRSEGKRSIPAQLNDIVAVLPPDQKNQLLQVVKDLQKQALVSQLERDTAMAELSQLKESSQEESARLQEECHTLREALIDLWDHKPATSTDSNALRRR